MQLLLFRHGIAEPHDKPDHDRALTSRGVHRTRLAAQGLARVADRPEVILSSPKVRAMQTAKILGDVYDLAPTTLDVIADGSSRDMLDALRRRDETSVALVGHEPTMSGLIELLCVGSTNRGFIELKKAGAALADVELPYRGSPGIATLHWLIPPRVLRALAKREVDQD